MDGNAGRPLGLQEADCSFGVLSGIIVVVIIEWDVAWVKVLVFRRSGHGSGHCRLKYSLGFNYCTICNGLLMW